MGFLNLPVASPARKKTTDSARRISSEFFMPNYGADNFSGLLGMIGVSTMERREKKGRAGLGGNEKRKASHMISLSWYRSAPGPFRSCLAILIFVGPANTDHLFSSSAWLSVLSSTSTRTFATLGPDLAHDIFMSSDEQCSTAQRNPVSTFCTAICQIIMRDVSPRGYGVE